MPEPADRAAAPSPDALLPPLRRLLRPLVRLLMQSGVTFPVLAELLRGLYVEVATRDLLSARDARTDSRVSLLTGVHRKELRRLRGLAPDAAAIPPVVTLGSQIIARWLGSAAYADAAGRPHPLPRAGDAPSFEALVRSVTTDVRPRAVLDDWISQNIVALDAADQVHLQDAAFIPRANRDEQLFFFARNLHDHAAAAAANVLAAGRPPFLDRSVHYDALDPAAAAQLEAAGRDAAQRLLVDINRLALGLAEPAAATAAPGTPTRRVNLGVYLYVEDEPAGDGSAA